MRELMEIIDEASRMNTEDFLRYMGFVFIGSVFFYMFFWRTNFLKNGDFNDFD